MPSRLQPRARSERLRALSRLVLAGLVVVALLQAGTATAQTEDAAGAAGTTDGTQAADPTPAPEPEPKPEPEPVAEQEPEPVVVQPEPTPTPKPTVQDLPTAEPEPSPTPEPEPSAPATRAPQPGRTPQQTLPSVQDQRDPSVSQPATQPTPRAGPATGRPSPTPGAPSPSPFPTGKAAVGADAEASPSPSPSASPTAAAVDSGTGAAAPAAGGGSGPPPRTRSRFTSAVRPPSADLLAIGLVLQNAIAAVLLILLMLFPAELFNSTLEENYDEIRARLGLDRPWVGRLRALTSGRGWHSVGLVAFLAVASIIGGLLDPDFGFDRASFALLLGIAGGLSLMIAVPYLIHAAYMRLRYGDSVRVRPIAGGLLVALGCVAISRLAGFEPGYLYGVIGGIAMRRELAAREEGRVVALASIGILVVSVVAWFAWQPIAAEAAASANPALGTLVLDALLAAVFVAGVETLAFGLLPLKFLDGERVLQWNRAVWLVLLAVGMFGFLHVLAHPQAGLQGSGAFIVVWVLFFAFGLFSVSFWAYFRFRRRPVAPV